MDGASRQKEADVGSQLKAPTREMIEQVILLDFPMSNNEAEYEAILVYIDPPNLRILRKYHHTK